ncbi:MAG: hypothetical protein A4E53_02257 [Pelotomaculum sp. PtaB.Bin104]|nr:MAG: hypothetical protein A4E53_02257 [Pelotomaculum sp. PtaB.Bin104]
MLIAQVRCCEGAKAYCKALTKLTLLKIYSGNVLVLLKSYFNLNITCIREGKDYGENYGYYTAVFHRSLLATWLKSEPMIPIIENHDAISFHSLKMSDFNYFQRRGRYV